MRIGVSGTKGTPSQELGIDVQTNNPTGAKMIVHGTAVRIWPP